MSTGTMVLVLNNSLVDNARVARSMLWESIVSLLKSGPLTNVEIAKALDLRSSYQNRHSDHLTYALLGDLLAQGKIVREEVVQSGRKQKSIVYRIALEETLTGPHI